MSQSDPASKTRVAGKGAEEGFGRAAGEGAEEGVEEVVKGAAEEVRRPLDRDSEGVYYMSIEDFERRIPPEPRPRAEPEPDTLPEKRA